MNLERRRIRISGLVQGIGFRPFVYKHALAMGLTGWVHNDVEGVLVEVQGSSASLDLFQNKLTTEPPPLANIISLLVESLTPEIETGFSIKSSGHEGNARAQISADLAVCPDCLAEMRDDHDRRFNYPFSNCTNCGPRFTIVRSIPYDRVNTSMSMFPMCAECAAEYHNPMDRRFHAQPTACPACGPALSLHTADGKPVPDQNLFQRVWQTISDGGILALRGLGGFHLATDPRHQAAVARLRQRKGRQEKPFALMARDVEVVQRYAHINDAEKALLQSRACPIVLLLSRSRTDLADNLAPGNRYLGFMLPYTPLHHLLLSGPHDLLIMTSGNYSEEPIAISPDEAFARLRDIADLFLLHNRDILQRCDDSVVMVADGAPRFIRRSRGYVPGPVPLGSPLAARVLACGGELKNTVAIGRERQVLLSQHIGDLDHSEAFTFFQHAIEHLLYIFDFKPEVVACDLHPDYFSTLWAQRQTLAPVIGIQHHHAHMAAVMAEHHLEEPCIGIILDGTGYGNDGTVWGGEILIGDIRSFSRWAWLEPVPMPGGEIAVREPWRMALSQVWNAFGEEALTLPLPCWQNRTLEEIKLVAQVMANNVHAPLTSSCGRLFDAVASLIGLRHNVTFEAQAAIELEMLCREQPAKPYDVDLGAGSGPLPISSLVRCLSGAVLNRVPVDLIARKFHSTLAELFIHAATAARARTGINTVALSGGVYQNRLFLHIMQQRLQQEGFNAISHRKVPTNDGGLALGQVVVAGYSAR